ncbi:intraflagellar transport protein 27 homolog isoform X2 [Dermacentor silvarum]|uniref:intraflagellar transport protein 27 homolog isoform X2 n=1 Tax=Dermacentor silvarum TaxID=543639 RepID=UPI002100777D|nr:intraflagellar transport protein 27 homolog isoform X2 [Dermacentor silvarum]
MTNILRVKCAVIGDAAIGKTALIQVFLHDRSYFPKNYSMELYLYDCSGKEVYLDFVQELWADAPLAIIMFDTCSEPSFQHVSTWASRLSKNSTCGPKIGVLVGMKADLKERRRVSPKEGQDMAERIGFHYLESSAKEAEGVQEPFFYLASQWHKTHNEKGELQEDTL